MKQTQSLCMVTMWIFLKNYFVLYYEQSEYKFNKEKVGKNS